MSYKCYHPRTDEVLPSKWFLAHGVGTGPAVPLLPLIFRKGKLFPLALDTVVKKLAPRWKIYVPALEEGEYRLVLFREFAGFPVELLGVFGPFCVGPSGTMEAAPVYTYPPAGGQVHADFFVAYGTLENGKHIEDANVYERGTTTEIPMDDPVITTETTDWNVEFTDLTPPGAFPYNATLEIVQNDGEKPTRDIVLIAP